MLTYAISQGLIQMWQSAMVINLTAVGLTESWTSTLGIAISFSSVAVSIAVASAMDRFRQKMKLAIAVLLAASGTLFAAVALITEESWVKCIIQCRLLDDHNLTSFSISHCGQGVTRQIVRSIERDPLS